MSTLITHHIQPIVHLEDDGSYLNDDKYCPTCNIQLSYSLFGIALMLKFCAVIHQIQSILHLDDDG